MLFRPRNSSFSSSRALTRQRRWYTVAGVVLALALVLLAAHYAPHFLATPVQGIARPIIAARDWVGNGLGGFLSFFQNKASLRQQNVALQEELIFYKAATTERDYFLAQNSRLQQLLGQIASSSSAAQFVAANIVEKPNFSPYDTMLVAANSGEGITTGDLVFADPFTLVGFVNSVSAAAATVTAYSTPGQQINVLIGSSSVEAAATGLGGGTLEVRLPRNSLVAAGDIVTAAGLPGNYILGRVTIATSTPTDPYERVLFTSPLDIFDLSYVLIKIEAPASHFAPHGSVKK